MGLLQPWLLALGLGMAVPLLLHLFQRHQGPRVIFPALRYLRRAEKDSARRVKLRQWLLMLLRMIVVLLVTLAATRPFLLGAGSAHQPSAVVIVLDNSMSTGAVTGEARVFDELRERALETLERAGPDDRFWLLRTGSGNEPALAGDAVTTAQRVRATETTSASANLAAALDRARAILSTGAEGRAPEIQLLTDLQASELRGIGNGRGAPAIVAWSPSSSAPANGSITGIEVAGGMAPLAGGRTQLAVRLGGDAQDSVNVRLFLADRLMAAASARGGAAVVLSLPPRPAGLLRGRVETDPDALRADDARYFVTRVLPPPVVAATGASEFLQDALAVMEQAGRVRTKGGEADVQLVSGSSAVRPRANSTVVIIPPASTVELPALNRMLSAAGIGWVYAPGAQGGNAQFALADSTDPLERSLQQVQLRQNYTLSPRGGGGTADSVLLRTRQGGAWAVRGELRGGGRFVLLGSSLDAEATSIPTSAAMIPLLDRIIGTWAAARAERLDAQPGDRIPLPAGATAVLRPDGVSQPVSGSEYAAGELAGVYEVRAGDSLLSAFAVNSPAAESDLRRLRARSLPEVLAGWDVLHADDARAWRRNIYHARLGLELWRPLLLALLVALIVEAVIAAAGARRRASAAAAVEAA